MMILRLLQVDNRILCRDWFIQYNHCPSWELQLVLHRRSNIYIYVIIRYTYIYTSWTDAENGRPYEGARIQHYYYIPIRTPAHFPLPSHLPLPLIWLSFLSLLYNQIPVLSWMLWGFVGDFPTQDSSSLLVDMDCLGGYKSGHESMLGIRSMKKTKMGFGERMEGWGMGYDSWLQCIQ